MGRRFRRRESAEFEMYSAPTVLGVRFVRRISLREGDDLVSSGKAKLLFHEESGRYVFQLVAEPAKAPVIVESAESSCVLTRPEAETAIGFQGESKTAGLNAAQRKILDSLGEETHDYVERCQFKLNAFNPRFGRTVVIANP